MGSLPRHNSTSQMQIAPDKQFLQGIPPTWLLTVLKEHKGRDSSSAVRIISQWDRCCMSGYQYIHTGVTKIYKQIFTIQAANMILFYLQQKQGYSSNTRIYFSIPLSNLCVISSVQRCQLQVLAQIPYCPTLLSRST